MPIYYFDIRDGTGTHPDDTGVDLPDMDAAIVEGRRALADMSRDAGPDANDHDIEILIRDHDEGSVKLVLSFTTRKFSPDG